MVVDIVEGHTTVLKMLIMTILLHAALPDDLFAFRRFKDEVTPDLKAFVCQEVARRPSPPAFSLPTLKLILTATTTSRSHNPKSQKTYITFNNSLLAEPSIRQHGSHSQDSFWHQRPLRLLLQTDVPLPPYGQKYNRSGEHA